MVAAGVAAAGLLAGVGEGAFCPVVGAGAAADLELKHSEVVGGEGIGGVGGVEGFVAVVGRKEVVERAEAFEEGRELAG